MVRRKSVRVYAESLKDVAVQATDVVKTFRIPHEARHTVRAHFLHPFSRTTYETHEALSGVSLSIRTGECFGIVGRNGSGKSTLLKILAGIYRADSGSVRVNGRLSPFIELGVGFNPELSGRDNVVINGTLLGIRRRELQARFDEIIAFAELERFVDQKLKNYSSGMQVRLAYAVAIQAPFDILLVDEVLAVGDASFQQKCLATFEEFRAAGKTVVFVSHSPEALRRYCDRALLLDNGVMRSIGPAGEVINLSLELQGISTDEVVEQPVWLDRVR